MLEVKMDMNVVNPQLYNHTNGILMVRYMHPSAHIERLKKMPMHEQDVFVTGYPKSGNITKKSTFHYCINVIYGYLL